MSNAVKNRPANPTKKEKVRVNPCLKWKEVILYIQQETGIVFLLSDFWSCVNLV